MENPKRSADDTLPLRLVELSYLVAQNSTGGVQRRNCRWYDCNVRHICLAGCRTPREYKQLCDRLLTRHEQTSALVAVLGETSRREMGEWLENPVMRDFVQRQADGNEVAYRVRNKLVREAAYRMLNATDRVPASRGGARDLPERPSRAGAPSPPASSSKATDRRRRVGCCRACAPRAT
jgi:hypothetical protein